MIAVYLDETEYQELTGQPAPDDYKHLELRASSELDTLTRFYFQKNELGNDFVSNQFKKALAVQILFFIESDTTSSEAMNSQPDSIRIGNTTVSYNRTGTSSEASRRSTAVSQDALNLLKGTGLLYRGGVYGA